MASQNSSTKGKSYQRVAEDLRSMIESGEYRPLSRLPAERELASTFDVSRTTVREALLALEAARVIRIRNRSGAYVLEQNTAQSGLLRELEESPGPHEVLHLRRLIEGDACFSVAQHGSAEDVRAVVTANDRNAAISPDDTPGFHRASYEFHLAIVQAADNSLYAPLFEYLWAQKDGPLWENWYHGTKSRKNRVTMLVHNQEITNAISSRRPDAARTAMHHHIDWMIDRFLRY